MEDLLLNIAKEASSAKLTHLKQKAQEAHDLLAAQTNLLRNPSHELRAACFLPLKLSLESKKSKLVALALTGLNKMIRDDRLQSGPEPEDDSLWMPAQLLAATASAPAHCEEAQARVLRVWLALACSATCALNGRLVMLLLGRCAEAYAGGAGAVRVAAQAAACQTLAAFCAFLDEECQEILQQQQKYKNSGSSAEMVYTKTSAVACFNEAIPVMQYICSKLEENRNLTKSSDQIVFLLECLLTFVTTLPPTVHSNIHFTTFLWQKFCPALLAFLGTPGDSSRQPLTTGQSRIVYSIGIQVVRLVGRERALRPVLEALFHRMLLLPSPAKRLEPLKVAREMLRSPARLADLLLLSGPVQRHAGDDMAIIRLIMDSIEESSQCSDTSVLLASIECVGALLGSLEALCRGEGLNQEATDITNSRYVTLEQADYSGPLTYESLARLPKPYRDVVANLKYHSDSDSSGIEGNIPGVEGGTESDCSGATEGPEDGSISDDSIMDDDSFLTNQQLQKLYKLPKSLNLGRTGVNECNTDIERHNAKHFVRTLQYVLLPNLITLRSSIQVDEVLQEFSSKCCQHNSTQNYEISTIMNADGIYLATYSALLLDLKLIQSGHFDENIAQGVPVPITETQFVEEVHGSGVLVYVSATWLCELYQNVLAKSLLLSAGYNPKSAHQPSLISLLTDVGGLCPTQLLSDWQKLQKVHGAQESSPEMEAGIKLSRRVLTCCWSSVVAVLGTPLEAAPNTSRASALGRLVARRSRQKHRQKMLDDIMTVSLEGLQKAASLSNTLKLQARSSSILALLSSSSCKSLGVQFLASHALSLDVILSKGLELGCHSPACWRHVFDACVAVASLEHSLFSKTGSTHLLMVAQNTQNNIITSTTTSDSHERLPKGFNMSNEEETCIDVYNFLQNSTYAEQTNEACIAEIVEMSGANTAQGQGVLRGVYAAKVCCVLSQKSDELFHSAALRLSLPGLCNFLTELCMASHTQLFTRYEESPTRQKKWWRKELDVQQKPPVTLLLHRISEVTLKCIKSGRPLIHIMKVWSIVGPHFMQAACHKDRTISKKAVTCIHDAVTALLNEQAELPHFHFNEALIKPFENLLCLELCDIDVQDQIVYCLCEFVEANRTEISSGWRPLFGTLRVANSKNNATAILEVFKIFLSTDNTLVFANAALDYILCLLSHIKNSTMDDGSPDVTANKMADKMADKKSSIFLDREAEFPTKLGTSSVDLCLESLELLKSCAVILTAIYNMPKCPIFNMTHRVNVETSPQLVDPVIQSAEVDSFGQIDRDRMSYEVLCTQADFEDCEKEHVTLAHLDKKGNVLRIYYILLEGLASASAKNRPLVVDTLFEVVRGLATNPGVDFALCCVNHVVLPMLQSRLRQQTTKEAWQGFKHCCGLATDLVVDLLGRLGARGQHPGGNLALKQLLLVLIECTLQPCENVALLGASCIRHVILTAGRHLSAPHWHILVAAIHRACTATLDPLHQLSLAFRPDSDSFYGDLATVRVAARRDAAATAAPTERLRELAHQVLLMPSQRRDVANGGDSGVGVDDRSYVFLLHPHSGGRTPAAPLRVPFRGLVIGILVHQMLVQTVSSALLQNLHHITPVLDFLRIGACSLRGVLTELNAQHVDVMVRCLEVSRQRAREFDARPGLKFLAQKVGGLGAAANLYTQSNTSEVVQIIVLIELCLDGISKYGIGPGDLKDILAREAGGRQLTDLDYVEGFLRGLRAKWDALCESYVGLGVPMARSKDSEQDGVDPGTKPFRLSDLGQEDNDNLSMSTDSEGYLEKDALPNLKTEDNLEDASKGSLGPLCGSGNAALRKEPESVSTDDETDEMAAKSSTRLVYERYKTELGAIKYDKNTLLQMRSSLSADDLGGPAQRQAELVAPTGKAGGSLGVDSGMDAGVPPPQPVPAEIQQQRALSIFKDSEAYRMTRIETMEACLELLSSLSSGKLAPLATILKRGAVLLLGAQDNKIKKAAEDLLQRMNISYIDHDDY